MSVAAVYLYLFIKIIYCKISTSPVDIIIFIMILTQAQGRRQEIFSGGAFRFHRGAHFFMISETDIHQNNNNLYYYLNWSSSILKHI